MRQSGKNSKKHISQLCRAGNLAAKIPALPTAPGGGCRQSKTKKRKIYRLPPQAVDKGFADKKIRKKNKPLPTAT
jgi:hypothetical protein